MGVSDAIGAVSAGSSLMGAMGSNDVNSNVPTNQMNGLLSQYLQQGLGYSEGFTDKAVGAQKDALTAALQAYNAGQQALQTSFDKSQALQSPYRDAGYQALDNYMDTLTMTRPTMGSRAYADIQNKAATANDQLKTLAAGNQKLSSLYSNGANGQYDIGNAPTLDAVGKNISQADIEAGIRKGVYTRDTANGSPQAYFYNGPGTEGMSTTGEQTWGTPMQNTAIGYYSPDSLVNNQILQGAERNKLAAPLLTQAQQLYDQQKLATGNVNDYLTNTFTADQQAQAAAINRGLFSGPVRTQVGIPR